MKKTITVLMNCESCGLVNAKVFVPERLDGQDVTDWMSKVCVPANGEAHQMLSPTCHPKTITDIRIPLDKAGKGIGYADDEGVEL
jgi:hypothetical protein